MTQVAATGRLIACFPKRHIGQRFMISEHVTGLLHPLWNKLLSHRADRRKVVSKKQLVSLTAEVPPFP